MPSSKEPIPYRNNGHQIVTSLKFWKKITPQAFPGNISIFQKWKVFFVGLTHSKIDLESFKEQAGGHTPSVMVVILRSWYKKRQRNRTMSSKTDAHI